MSLEAHPLIRDWLLVEDGRIVLKSGKVDIGQRLSTALARIVAEELCLTPEEVGVAPVRTGYSPDEGITSGSNSIEQSGAALRLAAASLRHCLLEAASGLFGVNRASLNMMDGLIHDIGSNRSLKITDLASSLDPALPVDPTVEPLPAASRQPLRGIEPSTIDCLNKQGIRVVRDGSFLAVAGAREYPTLRAAECLARGCDWDPGASLPEDDIFIRLKEAPRTSLPVVDGKPRDAALPAPLSATSHAATYKRPYSGNGGVAGGPAHAPHPQPGYLPPAREHRRELGHAPGPDRDNPCRRLRLLWP